MKKILKGIRMGLLGIIPLLCIMVLWFPSEFTAKIIISEIFLMFFVWLAEDFI